jgi:hypothetical protein
MPKKIVPKDLVKVSIEIPPIKLNPAKVVIIKVIWEIPDEFIPQRIPE